MASYTVKHTCTITFTTCIEADSEEDARFLADNLGDDDYDERNYDSVGEYVLTKDE